MSKSWPKEDRSAWNKSEVFKEYENSIKSNILRVSSIQARLELIKEAKEKEEALSKVSQDKMKSMLQNTKELNTELQKLKNTTEQIGLADDALDGKEQSDNLMFHQDNPYANNEDWEEDDIEDHVISDLKSMAEEAISDGNIKLAYKIERTIQEILDKE